MNHHTLTDVEAAKATHNMAIGSFLQVMHLPGMTVGRMRKHMSHAGFYGCWPDWTIIDHGRLTLVKSQKWLRYLFALEAEKTPQTSPIEAARTDDC